jgi:hypothetical protein
MVMATTIEDMQRSLDALDNDYVNNLKRHFKNEQFELGFQIGVAIERYSRSESTIIREFIKDLVPAKAVHILLTRLSYVECPIKTGMDEQSNYVNNGKPDGFYYSRKKL